MDTTMKVTNSLENLSKKQLAEQHAAVVQELMKMWGIFYPMSQWPDPLSAARILNDLMTRVHASMVIPVALVRSDRS
jgi:hypothetical protein